MTGTPTIGGTNVMAYIAGKQDAATILSGIAALSGNGLIAKTASGTVATRTLTGDTEIVVANGDGVSANPTLSIGAAMARLASPAFTGSPTAPTAADGTSNTVIATTAWVLRNAGTGGGGSGNANTNNSQAWASGTTNTANGAWVFNGTVSVADLVINSATFSGVWGFSNGGLGVTNAADARTVLGLVIGTDVQAYDADLLRIASVAWASGDFVYRDGTGLTNFVSTSTGRDLLSAANAAAGRSTLQTVNIAGDTFTGPVLVPYFAYNANLTNAGSNYVLTARAIAEKIEALSIGGFIASVDTNFDVVGSQLRLTNTVGTGRLVMETAVGTNAAFSSLTDVSVASRDRGEQAWYDGTNWKNMPLASPLANAEEWEEAYNAFNGSTAVNPFAAANVNNGSTGTTGNGMGRQGLAKAQTRLSAVDLYTGGVIAGGATTAFLTNRFISKIEFVPTFTNGVTHYVGYSDGLNQAGLTNAPTDSLMLTITNGTMRFVASQGGSSTVASTTFVVPTNTWLFAVIEGTNQIAVCKVYTNRVLAFSESINSANVPNGIGALLGFGFGAYGTTSASTNGVDLMFVNQMGYRWQNKGLN
jgi:hypothetical protein